MLRCLPRWGKELVSSLLHEGCTPSCSWPGSSYLNPSTTPKQNAMHNINESMMKMRQGVSESGSKQLQFIDWHADEWFTQGVEMGELDVKTWWVHVKVTPWRKASPSSLQACLQFHLWLPSSWQASSPAQRECEFHNHDKRNMIRARIKAHRWRCDTSQGSGILPNTR
jgi:hypothetical protein